MTRNHWITLGWDKESWSDLNYDGFSNPTTESLDWSELNEEQQHSAEMLGYDEAGWNAGEDEEEKKGGEQKERDPDEGFMGFDWKTLWYALGALTLWYGYTTWLDYNEKKKWDKVGLTKDDRVEILNWIKPICDGYTDASWKDKEHETKHQETLDYDGEHVMKMLRTCFLQLAVPIESDDNDDVDPVDSDDNNIKLHRMAITRDSWLKHAGCDENVELKKASLALFHAADIDHDEYVDFNEFAMLLVLLTVGSDTQIDSSALADLLFTMMDHDGNDELSFQEVDDFLELARNAGNRRCDNTFAKDVFAAAAAMDYEVRVADYETVTKEYGWSKTREAAHQELTEEYLSSGFKIEFLSRDLFVRTVGSTIAREMAIGLHFLHVDDYLNPDTGQVIAGDGDPTGHHLNTMPKELHSFSNEFAKLITAGVLARAWQENHGYRHQLTSGVGGGSYRGGGCFAPGTLVLMGDMRSTTKIEELRPGDVTAGGTVKAAMQFDKSLCAPMYKLHGVSVTGDHAVLVVLAKFLSESIKNEAYA